MSMIKGSKIILIKQEQTSVDEFNAPIYTEHEIEVENVLIQPLTSSEIINELNLNGKKATYCLCIPKTDSNSWKDSKVVFFGKTWKTYGDVIEYQQCPTDWNRKVYVEHYE